MNQNMSLEVQKTVCMKNVAPHVTPYQLKNLCEPFGVVLNVKLTKGPVAFVTMDTIENCHKAIEGLTNNVFGIKAEPSKGPKHTHKPKTPSKGNQARDSSVSSVRSNAGVRNFGGARASRAEVKPNVASSSTPGAKDACLKKIPRNMTKGTIEVICGVFAEVENVTMGDQCAYVKLKSSSDFDKLMQGLKSNNYGIVAEEHKIESENKICIKNVPPKLGWVDIKMLCGCFGNVVNVERKDTFAVVKMASKADLEKVIEGLKSNLYGMIVERTGDQIEKCKADENAASSSQNVKPSVNAEPPKQNGIASVKKTEELVGNNDEKKQCFCGKPANTVCQRCGDFYCSSECQDADWQMHRYICVPKPKLVSGDSSEIGNVVESVTSETPKLVNRNSQLAHQKAISKAKLPLSSKTTSNVNSIGNVPANAPNVVPSGVSSNTLAKPNSNNNGPIMASTSGNTTRPGSEVQNNDSRGIKNSTEEIIPTNSHESFSFTKSIPKINPNIKANDTQEKQTQKECELEHKTEVNETKQEVKETKKESELKHQAEASEVKAEECSVTIDWDQNYPKKVCITAYRTSNFLWVRSMEKQHNDAYIKMMDKISSLGRNCPQLEKQPNCGDIVITDYEDKIPCRAQVIHIINENNIIVKFMDIGPLETKELKRLRQLPVALPKFGNFIHAIKLFQVPDFNLNSEATNLLNNYMRNSVEMKMFRVNEGKNLEFILKENSTNENINESILKFYGKDNPLTLNSDDNEKNGCSSTVNENNKAVENSSDVASSSNNNLDDSKKEQLTNNDFSFTSNSSTVKTENIKSELTNNSNNQISSTQEVVNESLPRPEVELESNRVFAKDIQYDVLPNEEYVNVYVADNSLLKNSIVSCIYLKKVSAVKQFNQTFDDYARTLSETYIPRLAEICLALNEEDQKWYRAELMELLNMEKAVLKFIDLGCTKNVETKNIRKYSKDFVQPCHTSTCTIAGFPTPLDEKTVSTLQKLFTLKGKIILDRVEAGTDAKTNLIHVDLTEL